MGFLDILIKWFIHRKKRIGSDLDLWGSEAKENVGLLSRNVGPLLKYFIVKIPIHQFVKSIATHSSRYICES